MKLRFMDISSLPTQDDVYNFANRLHFQTQNGFQTNSKWRILQAVPNLISSGINAEYTSIHKHYTFSSDFIWAGNKRPNPIHPNNENVRHEMEMPTLPKSRRALLSFNYICGTNDTTAASKAYCKIEIFFR